VSPNHAHGTRREADATVAPVGPKFSPAAKLAPVAPDTMPEQNPQVARYIAMFRLQWLLHIEPSMTRDAFAAYVQAEDRTIEQVIDRYFGRADPDSPRTRVNITFDADVLAEYPTEEHARAEMMGVVRAIQAERAKEALTLGRPGSVPDGMTLYRDLPRLAREHLLHDGGEYEQLFAAMVALFESVEAHKAAQRGATPDASAIGDIRAAAEAWRGRTLQLSPALIGSVHTITREYAHWLARHPDCLPAIAWDAFERLIAEVFASHGFRVELTGRSQDRSADIIAIKTDSLGVTSRYLIECKRYDAARRVDLAVVNAVLGAKVRADADHAFLVTTSSFTKNVIALRPQLESQRLHLRDGDAVREWLTQFATIGAEGTRVDPLWDFDRPR
jgi:hypothetical protein